MLLVSGTELWGWRSESESNKGQMRVRRKFVCNENIVTSPSEPLIFSNSWCCLWDSISSVCGIPPAVYFNGIWPVLYVNKQNVTKNQLFNYSWWHLLEYVALNSTWIYMTSCYLGFIVLLAFSFLVLPYFLFKVVCQRSGKYVTLVICDIIEKSFLETLHVCYFPVVKRFLLSQHSRPMWFILLGSLLLHYSNVVSVVSNCLLGQVVFC